MQDTQRVQLYALLSRIYSDVLDEAFIRDLKQNEGLVELIGFETKRWLGELDDAALLKELNIDFSSLFLQNTQPIETFVSDTKNEVLVGLQNPVMQFYYQNDYEIDMNQTHILAPDHLAIELAFMQAMVHRNEYATQKAFLEEHLMKWVIPYMQGVKAMALTPFYRDVADFTIELIASDYQYISEVVAHGIN